MGGMLRDPLRRLAARSGRPGELNGFLNEGGRIPRLRALNDKSVVMALGRDCCVESRGCDGMGVIGCSNLGGDASCQPTETMVAGWRTSTSRQEASSEQAISFTSVYHSSTNTLRLSADDAYRTFQLE